MMPSEWLSPTSSANLLREPALDMILRYTLLMDLNVNVNVNVNGIVVDRMSGCWRCKGIRSQYCTYVVNPNLHIYGPLQ